MIKSKIVKLYHSAGLLSVLILEFFLIVWTYDEIGAATATYTQLSDEICKNAVNHSFVADRCCYHIIEMDKYLEICYKKFTTSVENVENVEKNHVVQLSLITECLYEKWHYIKSDNELNMTRVEAEANRLYSNDIFKKNFVINMYQFCAQKATAMITLAEENPKAINIVGARKPYFMLHYLCVKVYYKKQCPYFIWEGRNEIDLETCIDYADECVENINE